MTRDPAAQAVHERLEHAVVSMPAFDVEAGWASLAPQLDSPVAPVIPLRRRRPRRVVALAVAAAVFIGGSALAAVRLGSAPGLSLAPTATIPGAALVTGPHVHAAFTGAPPVPDQETGGGDGDGTGGGSVDEPSTSGSDGGSDAGSDGSASSGDTGGASGQDSPDDIDQGSGNDGQHDDNGQGNDAQGQDSQGDTGQGGGGTGDGGSGDQGSNGQ